MVKCMEDVLEDDVNVSADIQGRTYKDIHIRTYVYQDVNLISGHVCVYVYEAMHVRTHTYKDIHLWTHI